MRISLSLEIKAVTTTATCYATFYQRTAPPLSTPALAPPKTPPSPIPPPKIPLVYCIPGIYFYPCNYFLPRDSSSSHPIFLSSQEPSHYISLFSQFRSLLYTKLNYCLYIHFSLFFLPPSVSSI